jgi:HPt (histidine-containing phosphotransfer) domain-containing protein
VSRDEDDEWLRDLWGQVRPAAAAKVEALAVAIGQRASGEDPGDDRPGSPRRLAHDLAGSLGTYGHLDASAAASELERALIEGTLEPGPALDDLLERLRSVTREAADRAG